MKKQILVAMVSLGLVASAFSQGTVTMGNNSSSLITIEGVSMPVGSVLFQLYAGPQGADEGSLVAQLPTGGTSTLAPGRMANVNIAVAGVAPGAIGTFQIWAWDSSYATYELAAASSYVGKSALFTSATGGVGEPASLPVALAGQFSGFNLTIVPEPTTLVLAGMGAASLLLFRRRK